MAHTRPPALAWQPVHVTGALVLALSFVDASWTAWVVRGLLFLLCLLSGLDVALTRYHLWRAERPTPALERFALVTGASAGLGREMSYLLCERKYSLVLAARTASALERMRAEMELVHRPTQVLVCVCDLATADGIDKLRTFVHKRKLVIDILVNNAAACLTKDFVALSEAEVQELLMLDVHAMVQLSHALVPQMIERHVGRVLNISSMAGVAAVPTAALYGSSKAFVTSFSQALSYEVRATGVTVTCMCPGPLSTANFSKTANLDNAICMKLPGVAADAKDTAKVALDAMFNGEVLVYDTWYAYLSANLVQCVMPRRLAALIFGAGMHELENVWQMIKR
ncbi:unnamed protein product [Hyaloperonospora brassicae]|uniref:RxLR effector candidate protein n=1 Tax=Hyaloperonospora brassicae TaxID=162125 RepID=A0AAV0T8V9_HYABA|nr:unnamed protein product [Hyaloperonospora brassicae]